MEPHRHRLPVTAHALAFAAAWTRAIPMGWYRMLCSETTGVRDWKTLLNESKTDVMLVVVGIGVSPVIGVDVDVGVGVESVFWSSN